MENLRQAIENDLHDSLEGEFKVPIEITYSNGETQIYSKNNPSELFGGQVLYFTKEENPETGEIIIVDNPVVTLRISSMNKIPVDGENGYVKMPVSPVAGSEKLSFVFTATRSKMSGTDIGFLRLYLQKIENTGEPIS